MEPNTDTAEFLLISGAIALAIGIGFLISAATSFALSQILGLADAFAVTEIRRGFSMELVRPAAAVLSKTTERSAVTEDEFHRLYERTALPLRAYLYRMLNDISRADDILQETYLRFLQAHPPADMTEEHRKNYLFRIATNLMHDEAGARKMCRWRTIHAPPILPRTFGSEMTPRDALSNSLPSSASSYGWLMLKGSLAKEIAEMIGVKAPSIRPMLARARERLSKILKEGGFRSA